MSSPSLSLLQGDPSTWGVPPSGKTYVGINEAGQLVTKQNDGTITPIVGEAPSIVELDNSSGQTDIVASSANETVILTITGGARTIQVVLDTDAPEDGYYERLRLQFPALDDVIIEVYNTVASGPPLWTFTSATGSGVINALLNLQFLSGAWVILSSQVPASAS